MNSILDDYFPREETPQAPPEKQVETGVIEGLPTKRKRARGAGGKRKPHVIRRKSEELARYLFNKVLGASVTKSQVQEVPTQRGVFYKSTDVDLVGSMPLRKSGVATVYPVKVEVKGLTGGTFPLSRISDHERRYLNDGRRAGAACFVCLIVWPKAAETISRGNVERVFLVSWRRWLECEAELLSRAAGNFKGQSLRRKDFDLFGGCEVVKVSRRWQLEPGHWLLEYLPGGDPLDLEVF